jgi:flagellar biosynthesis protein FliQ
VADVAYSLYIQTMQTSLTLAIPVVAVIGCVGVIVSLAQTIVGIQDQNISFGPKIVALAAMIAFGGSAAFVLLARLLLAVIAALPRLAG